MIEGELMGKLESERSGGRDSPLLLLLSFPNPASKRAEKIGGYVRYRQSFFARDNVRYAMRSILNDELAGTIPLI